MNWLTSSRPRSPFSRFSKKNYRREMTTTLSLPIKSNFGRSTAQIRKKTDDRFCKSIGMLSTFQHANWLPLTEFLL
ncbi:hypothetical protein IF1G_09649 [Cordyceps javanica]|uniref:Uncharacterized protein n=1 Tax=Cordyceps javanica TaxID=43265 RepID=A0A545UQ50_9HYPO|nr:hypothetical protein IF1G_09649 [Cordyceps javanica]